METYLEGTDTEVRSRLTEEGVLSAADEAKLELTLKEIPVNIAIGEVATEVAVVREEEELLPENGAPRSDEVMLLEDCVADSVAEEGLVAEMDKDVEDTELEVDVPTPTPEEDDPVGNCTLFGSVKLCEEDSVFDTIGGMPIVGTEVEDGTLLEEGIDATVRLV